MQYWIENDWNLVLSKCEDQEAEKKWVLKQKIAGQLCELVGRRKVYYDNRAKNPKNPKNQKKMKKKNNNNKEKKNELELARV